MISKNLQKWIDANHLDVVIVTNETFEVNLLQIKDTELFFFLVGQKEKLFDNELFLLLTDEEYIDVDNVKDHYKGLSLLFEFGEAFYYCPVKLQKDTFNEQRFKITGINDFLYLGKAKVQSPTIGCLGIHSEYEILNVALNYNNALKKAKFLDYKTVAICDHNTLAGTLGFQLKAKELGLKSIMGETVSVVYNYNSNDSKQTAFEVKLYVVNETGWTNLLSINKLINVDNTEGYILHKDLLKRAEGLILVIDYTNSYFRDLRDLKEYSKKIEEYQEYFENVFFQFSSVIFTDDGYDLKCLQGFKFYLDNYSSKVDPVFVDDVFYLERSHSNCKQLLNKIGGFVKQHSYNQYLKTEQEVVKIVDILFDENSERNIQPFLEFCFENNIKLSEACNFNIVTTERKLPKYEVDGKLLTGKQADDLFTQACEDGYKERVIKEIDKKLHPEYRQRFQRELKVILEAELSDYFLILWDMINWVKANNIRMGPGRGSVAGSLLAYVIGLTDTDPIKYDLLFERFLNEARFKITFKYELELEDGSKKSFEEGTVLKLKNGEEVKVEELKVKNSIFLDDSEYRIKNLQRIQNERIDQMPDIDLDFSSANRDDVKDYMAYKYGLEHVCSLGTYGRLKLKQSFTDLAKINGHDFKVVKDLTKQMDKQLEYTWFDLFKFATKSGLLYDFIQSNSAMINDLKVILNNPKSVSVHPSAIAILPKFDQYEKERNLEDWMPIRLVDGKIISEWEGKYTDRFGILKEDILGVEQLDKFEKCLALIEKHTEEYIDLNKIDYEDEKVFNLFKKGHNEDVFQFGSFGLKNFSREVEPDTLDELVAMTALFRPGPMSSNFHRLFSEIKKGKKEPEFLPGMRSITESTNSLFIYQEQIMKAVMVANFTAVQADSVRSVMKKFDRKTMLTLEEKFVNGLMEKKFTELVLEDGTIKEFEDGTFDYSNLNIFKKRKFTVDLDTAKDIWSKLLAFSGYGFNKCTSGNTIIYRFTGNQFHPKELSIERFYEIAYSENTTTSGKYRKQGHLGYVRYYNLENKKIQYAKVKQIHKNGKKQLYKIVLKNGMFIEATLDHRLLKTNHVYEKISHLEIGDFLIVNGEKDLDYDFQEREDTKGIGSAWINNFDWKERGEGNRPKIDGRTEKHVLVKEIVLKRSGGKCERCTKVGGRMEYHHVDANHFNDVEENVMYVCNSCHKKLDYEIGRRNGDRSKGYFSDESEIISITKKGIEETYDLEMFENPHNYIANGIVSHNSHSQSYTLISYQSQWLKANYPLEFWTTALNFGDEKDDVPYYLTEIKQVFTKIKIDIPDINKSEINFTCDPTTNRIFWSLTKVKGIGDAGATAILEARKTGEFTSMKDFLSRVSSKANKKVIKTLILAGAFDLMYGVEEVHRRRKILEDFYTIKEPKDLQTCEYYNAPAGNKNYYWILVQKGLIGNGELDFQEVVQNSNLTKTLKSCFIDFNDFLKKKISTGKFYNKGQQYSICGFVTNIKEYNSKGGVFCKVELENNNSSVECLVWNSEYVVLKDLIHSLKGKMIVISGRLGYDDYRKKNSLYINQETEIAEL